MNLKFLAGTRFRLVTGFTIIILLMAAIVFTVFFNFTAILRTQQQIDQHVKISEALALLKADQNRARVLVLDIIIAQDRGQMDHFKHELSDKTDELDTLYAILVNHYKSGTPSQVVNINSLQELLSKYRTTRLQQFQFLEQGKTEEALNLSRGVQSDNYEHIRSLINLMQTSEANQLAELRASLNDSMQDARRWLVWIGIVAVITAIILTLAILRLQRRILREINRGILVLSGTATDLLTNITEASTSATETATAIAETTTTIEEVRQTAELSSDKARVVAETSQKAASIAAEGKQSVFETIEGMKKINQQMVLITESVIKLSEQSRTIAEITTTVSDLADQSNLLAVNAAIEAAKAGEQGRGFAVVAQEIRTLAEQSKQSTAQVKEILNDIQKSVNIAVQATESGNSVVETGTILAAQSGDVIQLMNDSVTEASHAAMQISASSQQQKVGMEQLVPAMANIKLASEQIVAGNKLTQKAAQSLDELSKNLKKIIETYNI